MMIDNSTILAASKGDISAFKKIFNYFLPKMRPLCLRYVQSHFEADDVLQESFIKIYNHLDKFKFQGSFEGWIKKIVINTALNHIKKKNTLKYDLIDDIDENEIEQEELQDISDSTPSALLSMIDLLPSGYKIVFQLYVFDDYSHKEIAEMLGIAEASSRSQYAKAKKMILKLMSRQRIEDKSSLLRKIDNGKE